MATDILMPQLGESIAEGTVVKWLVPPGGAVERDQPLLVVETEKVALDIPSPGTGFLTEIVVQEGETVPVGTLLGKLEDQPRTGVVNRVGGVVVRPMDAPAGDGPHLSPAVRQLAKEHHVDVASIVGSGEGGRVTKKDVLEYVAARKSDRSAAPVATPAVRLHSQMRKTTPAHRCAYQTNRTIRELLHVRSRRRRPRRSRPRAARARCATRCSRSRR